MLKNHLHTQHVNDECWKITGITLEVCLFGQRTEKTLSNFELWKYWNASNVDDWDKNLVAFEKVSVLVILVKHRPIEKIKKSSL